VSGGADGVLKVWDGQSGRETMTLKGHSARVSGVAFSGDGKWLVSAGDRSIRVWDGSNAAPIRQ